MKVELRHDNHKVGINLAMNWQTKYCYNIFAKFKYTSLCEASICKATKRHNIKIYVLGVMPYQLHTLLTLPKGMSDVKALQFLTGCSSHTFFKNHPLSRLRYQEIFQISCSKNLFEIFVTPQDIFGVVVVVQLLWVKTNSVKLNNIF